MLATTWSSVDRRCYVLVLAVCMCVCARALYMIHFVRKCCCYAICASSARTVEAPAVAAATTTMATMATTMAMARKATRSLVRFAPIDAIQLCDDRSRARARERLWLRRGRRRCLCVCEASEATRAHTHARTQMHWRLCVCVGARAPLGCV